MAEAIKRTVPSVVLRNGVCVLKIEGEQPWEVAEKARVVLEKIRGMTRLSKGFK